MYKFCRVITMYVNIFRLPIYNKKPDELMRSLISAKEKRINELMATGLDKNYADYLYSISTKNKWELDNNIIGFLYIDYRSPCFEYRLAICKRRNSNRAYKMPLFTETKHYMQEQHIGGVYTPFDLSNNDNIAELILNDIELICDNYLKDVYCDLESFKLISPCIDYNKLLLLLKKN